MNLRSRKSGLRATVFAAAMWVAAAPVQAGLFDDMIDPQDGKFDMSSYLASARGFLPVPIIITEPAVGFGLGAAVAYFHVPEEIDREEHPHQGPPSITLGVGAYTENDTWFLGAGHSGVWKDDHVRYLGFVGGASINAKFFGLNGGRGPDQQDLSLNDGIEFNSEGWLMLQNARFRLRESNWWLGAEYLYSDIDNTFKLFNDLPIEIPDFTFNTKSAALGALVEYDGRNSTFTATQGTYAKFKWLNYDENWGGDFDYDALEAKVYQYFEVGDFSSIGFRFEGDKLIGNAPFYAYPFVDLRGIRALRYQGEEVLVGEVEYLWGFTPRWSLALFGGVGHTRGEDNFSGEHASETVSAGGVGIRYRLARKFKLQGGVDVAWGPEESSFYITVGSAWR